MSDFTTPAGYYYQDQKIVDSYDTLREPFPGEEELFAAYTSKETRLLDIGVGAGRTTRLLAPKVKRYVGIDYAGLMVKRARERFEGLEFHVADAADLSRFEDASFDTVLFSFNGLGVLPDDEARMRCLREVSRVLAPRGVFVFSLHNARCIAYVPRYQGANLARVVWRTVYAGGQTLRQARSRLLSPVFWRGSGFLRDPMQPHSPTIYACLPDDVRRETARAGFTVERIAGADERSRRDRALVPQYYYACRKR